MVYQSRLNAFRLDTSYLGLYVPELYVSIGGTDRTSVIIKDSFQISCSARTPYTFSFSVRGLELSPFEEVIVRDGGAAGKTLFAGHILPTAMKTRHRNVIVYDQAVAQDYTWLLDRFSRVTEEYFTMPINGIVNDILTNYTDGGFLPGNLSSSLGSLSMTFTNEKVSRALERIAAAIGGVVLIDPSNKHVSIVTSISDGHTITLDDNATDFWDFEYGLDGSQVRTRTIVEGRGSALAADAAYGDTTLTLESVGSFSSSGGSARLNTSTFTYAGVDDAAVQLTGVSGLTSDGTVGDNVNLIVQADNASAQSDLATLLGGGASGIVTHYIQDRRLSEDEASNRATQDVADFGAAIPIATYVTRDRFVVPFKDVTLNLTVPRTISDTLQVETVRMRMGRKTYATGDQLDFEFAVTATPLRLSVTDLLDHVVAPERGHP